MPRPRVGDGGDPIARLWDASRDPRERVTDEDWHPSPDDGFADLEAGDSLEQRRRWFVSLLDRGEITMPRPER